MIQESARANSGAMRTDGRLFEHYRALAERIRQLGGDGSATVRTVGVTSCAPGEGVSTVAANLAATAANLLERPVLLIDGNLAQPSQRRWLRLAEGPGLADVLVGSVTAAEAVQESPLANLAVLVAGTSVARIRASFDPLRLRQFFEELRGTYGLVVVDLPAATPTSTCWSLAAALDGVLLVVEAERVSSPGAQQVKRGLIAAGANLLGVVLNKHREHLPAWMNR
jgi:capsular exopolysaccharide synthesis family protein